MKIGRGILFAFAAFLLAGGGTLPVSSKEMKPSEAMAVIQVNTTSDDITPNGNCTLREAIQAANTDAAVDGCAAGSGSDTIQLSAGTYAISLEGTYEDANQTGDFDITGSLTLSGAGQEATVIDAARLDRALDFLNSTGQYEIRDLTVQNGLIREYPPDEDISPHNTSGGNIRSAGSLRLLRARITGAQVDEPLHAPGGGIFNYGTLEIDDSLIDRNHDDRSGGAIASIGTLTIENTNFEYNYAYGAADLEIMGAGSTATIRHVSFYGSLCGPMEDANNLGAGAVMLMEDVRFSNIECENSVLQTAGDLTLSGAAFSGVGGREGAVNMDGGRLVARDTIFSGGGGWHGMVTISGGQALIERALFTGRGGTGLYLEAGSAAVVNSTFSGLQNTEENAAAVQVESGTLVLESVTIANNQSMLPALKVNGGSASIHNSLIAYNRGSAGESTDCQLAIGTTESLGFNFVGVTDGCGWISASGDITGTRAAPADPLLGPLTDEGPNHTRVQPLLEGSPAIDAADPVLFPPEDQRMVSRPQGMRADIGAFEARPGGIELPYQLFLSRISR